MSILIQVFGSFLLMALVVAGLLLIVAPSYGQRLLKNTAAFAGLFILGIAMLELLVCNAAKIALRILPILYGRDAFPLWSISVLAYFYCERHRSKKRPEQQSATSIERERVDARRVPIVPD